MKILFVWPNKDSFGFKPISLSILSGIARDFGFETQLFDTTEIDFGYTDTTEFGESVKICKPVDLSPYGHEKRKIDLRARFLETMEQLQPDCLAFSVLSDEFLIAAELSSIAKKKYPDVPIIWGGKYPTIHPQKALEMFSANFVCVGEGLDAFRDFLNALAGRGDLYCIPNIWARKKGSIIRNDVRPLRKTLDDLPYVDWSVFDKRQFYKPFEGEVYLSGDHMLNWGCPYHCTYCINHFYHELYDGRYFVRRYDVERIIGELKWLKTIYNLEFFKFHDEDFLMRPLRNMHELSEAYKEEINLPFVIETNAKSVTAEKAKLLKDMNCVSASLGIETGDPALRKTVLGRVDTEKEIANAFRLLKNAGIRTSAFIMLGIPFETRKSIQNTIELLRKVDVQYPCPGFFYPFEGTELRETAVNGGFFDPDDKKQVVYRRDWPSLHFEEFNDEELIQICNVFLLYVKLPAHYEPFIRRSEKRDRMGVQLRKKLLEIYDRTVFANDGWYSDDGLEDIDLKELNKIISGYNGNG